MITKLHIISFMGIIMIFFFHDYKVLPALWVFFSTIIKYYQLYGHNNDLFFHHKTQLWSQIGTLLYHYDSIAIFFGVSGRNLNNKYSWVQFAEYTPLTEIYSI